MKTRYRSLALIAIAFAAIISMVFISRFLFVKSSENIKYSSVKPSEDINSSKYMNNSNIGGVSASYSYPFKTVNEMKSDSDAIVLATLKNREQYSEVAVKSTLTVSKTIKGKHLDPIYLFELGSVDWSSSETLSKDTKYMLFLKHRWQDKPEIEDEFFIAGGIVGIIKIDENAMHCYEPGMDEDLQKMLKAYDKSKAVKEFIKEMSKP